MYIHIFIYTQLYHHPYDNTNNYQQFYIVNLWEGHKICNPLYMLKKSPPELQLINWYQQAETISITFYFAKMCPCSQWLCWHYQPSFKNCYIYGYTVQGWKFSHRFFEQIVRFLWVKERLAREKEQIAPVALLSWVTWANRSRHSFVKNNVSDSLTVDLL